MLIPIVLSAFTHLWNPIGFPAFHPDEGVYLRRSMHVLAGLGPQDPNSRFDHSQESTSSYDHPYFGQVLMASIFDLIGYPGSRALTDLNSINYYFTVPRVIMGIFSILDTFLIFRICERRYNGTVAVASAILFSVMPLSWLTRRIVLDSIQLPFVLLSILLIVEIGHRQRKTAILCVFSGICMGISIFTKIPSVTMIPLAIYLIYGTLPKYSKISVKKLKIVAMWLLPVILIPTIWPAYAIISGQFDEWIHGVLWQGTQRQEAKSLSVALINFLKADPVLFILGVGGIVFCSIRRDFLPLIWVSPYLALLYFVGWVTHFHLILLLTPFCIVIAKLIEGIPHLLNIKKNVIVSFIALTAIAIFGIVITTMLMTTNVSWAQLQGIRFVVNDTTQYNGEGVIQNDKVTVIASPIYSWLFKYVFDNQYTFTHVRDTRPIGTPRVVLVVDSTYLRVISGSEGENKSQVERLQRIYNNTELIALFKTDWPGDKKGTYPYTGMDAAIIGSRMEEIRANY